jgi:hypothetical protein
MATVTPQTASRDQARTHERVAHPLQRLRGSIRAYVSAEGALVLVLYLALWFWIGLLLDYGLFKVFTVDWVQELPHGFRVVVLCGLVAGLAALVVTKMGLRLFREFRDAALALVLERRYPGLLGDRLITAVELADPRLAARYGYSQAMVEQTIAEAAERVDRLAIGNVFDWKRLRRLGLYAAGLTVGIYLLVGAAYCAFARAPVSAFMGRFGDVAAIWFERNVLLTDTIWPRQAYLELLNFPGEEIRIGRDSPPPTLHVRALKWIIADKDRKRAPEGWRALSLADLTPELLGGPVPVDLQAEFPNAEQTTVDAIEVKLDKPEITGSWSAEVVLQSRSLLERLHERAALPEMSRRLRELEIPDEVEVSYRGATIRNNQTMQQSVDHEYSGAISDLKESIRFTVRGKDYYTPSKRIIVVPPPGIVRLTLDEAQPAYLYHRIPAGGSKEDLKGRKHVFKDRPISLTGDTSRIDVPAGTDVVLTAETDKELRPGGVHILPPRKGTTAVRADIEQPEAHTFRTRFANVTSVIDLIFEYQDTDGVLGLRHVIIRPVEDSAPEVDVQVEVVRKTNQGYMVTPVALIPFSGKVRDDRGLAAVEYAYTVVRVEAQAEKALKATLAAGMAAALAPGFGPRLSPVAFWQQLTRSAAADDDEKTSKQAPLATFEQLLKDRATRDVPLAKFLEALEKPPEEGLLKDYNLDPELENFNVEKLGLLVSDEKAVQPHYRMRLWVTATDNNVETGPSTGQSKEKFTFLIVSENELLTEIAKEEESLHLKLEEAVNRLKDGRLKLDNVAKELPDLKPEEFSPMARRADEIEEGIGKSWDAAREVFGDYRRILKELRANRVQPGMINKVNDKICEPLDGAINVEFVQADDALKELQKKLDAKTNDPATMAQAKEQLDKLIRRLEAVLDAMADVTTINQIIKQLVEISRKEQEEYERLKELLRQKEDIILEGAGGGEPKPPKEKKK